MAIWVMEMVRRLWNLEKIVPDGVLGIVGFLSCRLLVNGGEIAIAAIFLNMEDPSVSIDVSVAMSYDSGRDEGP